MKTFLYTLFTVILSMGSIQAAEKPLSAFAALKEAHRLLGDRVGVNLLLMECENAKLYPRYWWIRFYDEKVFLKIRAVQMIGPEMVKNVEPGNFFDGGDKNYIIRPDQLKYDSDECIAFMERAAKESDIPLHSLNMRLEKPYPEESSPIWYFEWFNEKGKSLGELNISATTGRVTEIIGLKLKAKRFQSVSKNTLAQDVQGAVVGVGTDIKEFFSGKHATEKTAEKTDKAGKSNNKDAKD